MDVPSYLLGKKSSKGREYTAGDNIEITEEGVINSTIPFSTDLASAITLGKRAYNSWGGIAIGTFCRNEGTNSIAIGNNGKAGYYTVALGESAKAQQRTSIAIGAGAETQKQHQMMIGGAGNDKYINEVAMNTLNGVKVLATEDYVSEAIGNTDIVTKDTEQTISAKKTFSTLPESSVVPTADNQLVNKKYVDDNAGGSSYTAGTNIAITEENVINNTIPYNVEPHTHSISLGSSMSINKSSNSQSVFIGDYVSCNFPVNSNVLVGFQASVFSNQAVNCIAIGRGAGVFGADSVAFGFAARGSHNNSMAFGSRSETTKENQAVFGSQNNPINEIDIYTSNGSKTLATEDYVNSAIANAITNALGGNY